MTDASTSSTPVPTKALTFNAVAEFQGEGGEGASEVVVHEDGTLFVTNGELGRIDIFDLENNAAAGSIDLTGLDGFDGLQSVAVKNGVVAAAVSRASVEETVFGQSVNLSQPGFVALFDAETGGFLSMVDVGNLPDQLTFNADGTQLLVAGEGEKNDDSENDDNPLGTVTIIDTTDPSTPFANILDFTAFNGLEDLARDAGVRIQEGISLAEDVEPEYISVSPDGTKAFVSLQENNAIATVDLTTGDIVDIFSLGTVDFATESMLDANDNGLIEIQNFENLVGFRMPDAIASFEIGGTTYIATANEGDSRDFDEDRVGDLVEEGRIDPSVDTTGLERLEVSTVDGDTDGDGDIDVLHTFSSRSFSIFDEDGAPVFDSGPEFEQIIAGIAPERFNDDDGDTDGDEDRSDAKGPEPEAITIGEVDGKTYAFIGLERDSGIMIYDISDPVNSSFVDYIPPKFVGTTPDGEVARHGPEVITFIPAADSSTGNSQIAVAYEISGTTIVYDLEPAVSEQPIVINEVLQSTVGTDVEFIELFGMAGASLAGLSLVAFNGNAAEAGDLNLRIDFTPDDVLGENGFLLIGTDSVFDTFGVTPDISISNNTFENDSEVFALVQTDTLVVEDETVIDDEGTVVVDAVASVNGDGDLVNFFDAPAVGPDGTFLPAGFKRIEDGVDTDTAEDFEFTDFLLGTDPDATNPLSTPVAGAIVPPPTDLTIMEIQGKGHLSAVEGQNVNTAGIVTVVTTNGFYMQDPDGDDDDATSDALFVFTGDAPAVTAGDAVNVAGAVSEFIPGGAGTGNLSTTQIVSSEIEVTSSGNDLPAATILGAAGRTPPTEVVISPDELPVNLQDDAGTFNPDTDGIDFYESLEGMLVTIDNPTAISATNRFGESWVVADDGAGTTPGLNDRGGLNLNGDADGYGDLNPERIQIQYNSDLLPDGFGGPTTTIGDNLSDVTGVVSYGFGNFEVQVTEAFEIETPSENVAEVTDIAGTEDRLTVATYNVLNVTSAEADGDAEQIAELAQQIVTNLGAPDIVALQEIQDDSGVADDGTLSAEETLKAIIKAIEDAGGPSYEFVSAVVDEDGENGGIPGGNIRNAYIWNPDRVEAKEFVTLESDVLAEFGVTNPDAFDGTRDPLLGTFEFNGEEVSLINNHFSSRFGSEGVYGANQPFFQAGDDAREQQSLAMNEVVDALLAEDAGAKVGVLGDLNTFDFTDDLTEDLPGTGDENVLTNLIGALEGDEAYTFVFQGNSQVLDHIFVTDGLLESSEVDVVHVNNDFAEFASDHEPVVASFLIEGGATGETIVGTNRRDMLEGTEGGDLILGLRGADNIMGNGGNDEIRSENGRNTISGGDGDDTIVGGLARDELMGDAGDDFINGGNSFDTITGGQGDDMLRGGRGKDDFIFEATFDDDTILDFELGQDELFFSGRTEDDLTIIENAEGTLITANDDGGSVLLQGVFGFTDDFVFV
ncbi:MAG: choice-of-anchor I family protein [Pseudomonadota bacterium]